MAKQERLSSLDAFRGFTIAGMMLVNNPGSWGAIYPQLEHAPWNGWTFTDFIFPFFLWIMGVAMTMSFAGRMERGDSKSAMRKPLEPLNMAPWSMAGRLMEGFGDLGIIPP